MVITSAGPGIMQAGHEGAGSQNSFGVNIRLPWEQAANPVIAEDKKLITFKYFFTRKLIFIRHSDAGATWHHHHFSWWGRRAALSAPVKRAQRAGRNHYWSTTPAALPPGTPQRGVPTSWWWCQVAPNTGDDVNSHFLSESAGTTFAALQPVWRNGRRTGLKILGP
jgi:hypothetical protein